MAVRARRAPYGNVDARRPTLTTPCPSSPSRIVRVQAGPRGCCSSRPSRWQAERGGPVLAFSCRAKERVCQRTHPVESGLHGSTKSLAPALELEQGEGVVQAQQFLHRQDQNQEHGSGNGGAQFF